MKAIQATFDERLLQRLDRDEEVRQLGRSAVLRRAVAEYLQRKRDRKIAQGYRQAYQTGKGLGQDWEGWTEEGVWPED